jgi:hypothetical protein
LCRIGAGSAGAVETKIRGALIVGHAINADAIDAEIGRTLIVFGAGWRLDKGP